MQGVECSGSVLVLEMRTSYWVYVLIELLTVIICVTIEQQLCNKRSLVTVSQSRGSGVGS